MEEGERKTENRQVDNNLTFQVRLNKSWWKILSQLKTDTGKSFKELVEDSLLNTYEIGLDNKTSRPPSTEESIGE
jgi:hypothetical protein